MKNKPMGQTRGNWNGIKPITRMTPTKKEKQQKQDKKHKLKIIYDKNYYSYCG